MNQDSPNDVTFQLREMLGKFPSGLRLTSHDLVFVGWLYFLEKSTRQRDISERELTWQIEQARHSPYKQLKRCQIHLDQGQYRQFPAHYSQDHRDGGFFRHLIVVPE